MQNFLISYRSAASLQQIAYQTRWYPGANQTAEYNQCGIVVKVLDQDPGDQGSNRQAMKLIVG